jgi:hypothetical protein
LRHPLDNTKLANASFDGIAYWCTGALLAATTLDNTKLANASFDGIAYWCIDALLAGHHNWHTQKKNALFYTANPINSTEKHEKLY